MLPILRPEEFAMLCRQYNVRRLVVFGSALRPDFDPQRSDVDFLVEFEPLPAGERMQRYFSLRAALAGMVSGPVDLIEIGAIRNPYILEKIAEQQQVLYAA